MNAPFPLFKQDASHLGSVRNGMIISWPQKVVAPGRAIANFAHNIDIVAGSAGSQWFHGEDIFMSKPSCDVIGIFSTIGAPPTR